MRIFLLTQTFERLLTLKFAGGKFKTHTQILNITETLITINNTKEYYYKI